MTTSQQVLIKTWKAVTISFSTRSDYSQHDIYERLGILDGVIEHDGLGVMPLEPQYGVRVTLGYQGKPHTFDQPYMKSQDLDGDDDAASGALFQWTEGNYACDCNRLSFIERYCDLDLDYPANDDGDPLCGREVSLIELFLVTPDGTERRLA